MPGAARVSIQAEPDSAGSRPWPAPASWEKDEVGASMVQKIGMFVLVTFAIIALIREPDTVAAFVTTVGVALQTIVTALGQLFQSVQ